MRLLTLLCASILLLPAAAWAADDELPPWEEPEGDDDDADDDDDEGTEADDDDDQGTVADDDDDDDDEPEPSYSSPAPGGYRSGSPVGLGFTAGTLNGFSLKIWPAQAHGIVFNVGVPNVLNSVGLQLGYRFHLPKFTAPGAPLHFHLYVGGNFRTRLVFYDNGTYVELGGGAAVGAALTVSGVPVEFWAEVVPAFVGAVSPPGVGVGFDVDGLVGVRFYPG